VNARNKFASTENNKTLPVNKNKIAITGGFKTVKHADVL
jgi:hypothetical protein